MAAPVYRRNVMKLWSKCPRIIVTIIFSLLNTKQSPWNLYHQFEQFCAYLLDYCKFKLKRIVDKNHVEAGPSHFCSGLVFFVTLLQIDQNASWVLKILQLWVFKVIGYHRILPLDFIGWNYFQFRHADYFHVASHNFLPTLFRNDNF